MLSSALSAAAGCLIDGTWGKIVNTIFCVYNIYMCTQTPNEKRNLWDGQDMLLGTSLYERDILTSENLVNMYGKRLAEYYSLLESPFGGGDLLRQFPEGKLSIIEYNYHIFNNRH
jgi:hypothetical protein